MKVLVGNEREIFQTFFSIEHEWIENHKLRNPDNLVILKAKFKEYVMDFGGIEEKEIFKKFNETLEQQIQEWTVYYQKIEQDQMGVAERKRRRDNGETVLMRRVKLEYHPSAPIFSDNPTIAKWMEASKIDFIPSEHLDNLNQSIQRKIKQNKVERDTSWEMMKKLIVK